MIKRVLLTILISVVVLGLSGGYFYHVSGVERTGREEFVCKTIDIAVRDSAVNRIITSSQIRELIGEEYLGMAVDSINLNTIETRIDSLGEVISSQVYATNNALIVRVEPRTAAVRFITDGGYQFYSDATGYIFPVESSVNTPVITGAIPVRIGKNFKGYSSDPFERRWIERMLTLTDYIENNAYWSTMTSHLNVDGKGDIELYPLSGNVKFIFGKPEDIAEKFSKMETWYKVIAPTEKAKDYTLVNLKYDNQIICR